MKKEGKNNIRITNGKGITIMYTHKKIITALNEKSN